ncbi:MAG: malic enzyme [Rhizobiales bacterium NRL2]|jgi:malate dehydrogenase (oxaloacetate-decarboxylating)(NADP+)|nr:MAG: malic enzyme [Rhizobiales bacterium NRL2]
MSDELDKMALDYHRYPTPGKISVQPTTKLANQRDLSLAYSPGVAAACNAIVADPLEAANMTARGNLVAVISNGTAVLGLGNIGALASKPVMEGKGVLFKKFAGIDVFDIEIDATDIDKVVDIVVALEPTFGGINLEDIGAPACFEIERKCRERMGIPVFHDDQHGTAICVGAAIYNALRLVEKDIDKVKVVCSGAGAAAQACMALIVSMGVTKENIIVCDRSGPIYKGRTEKMDKYKEYWAVETDARSIMEAVKDADVFVGVSGPGTLTGEMVKTMADNPIIMALANPTPEIMPEEAKAARPDAIIATGRSDFPNQVNNVLCFPFLFRGALDCGATTINEEMKVAATKAIADLTMQEVSEVVAKAYGVESLSFGREYIIPKPFDPRLIVEVSAAVAQAAMDSGVAQRPIEDMAAYRQKLAQYMYKTGFAMKPVFDRAKQDPKKIAYADGEQERILRAAQVIVDDGLARPVLIGRREVIERRINRFGLRIKVGQDVDVFDVTSAESVDSLADTLRQIMGRRGVTPEDARYQVRTNPTVIASLLAHRGEVDGMLCGLVGRYDRHIAWVRDIIGLRRGVREPSGLELIVMDRGTIAICDTHVTDDPDAEEVAEMAVMAAEVVNRFGIEPRVALLAHSNFGDNDDPSSRKMREAYGIIRKIAPDLEIDGEMKGDTALNKSVRDRVNPDSTLTDNANVLVCPNMDAANIAYNLVKETNEGMSVGPILIGMAKSAHVITPAITTRGIVNMTAVAVVAAQDHESGAIPAGPLSQMT